MNVQFPAASRASWVCLFLVAAACSDSPGGAKSKPDVDLPDPDMGRTADADIDADRLPNPFHMQVSPESPTTLDDVDCWLTPFPEDPDGDQVNVSYAWRHGDTVVDGPQLSAVHTQRDQIWTCHATVNAGAATLYAQKAVTIGNSSPSTPQVTIVGDHAGDALRCEASGVEDADEDEISYIFEWFLDGEVTAYTGADVASGTTAPGQVWTCQVVATDGALSSQPGEAQVLVANQTPEAGTVAISPEMPRTADDLSCAVSASLDPDGDDITYAYRWLRDGTDVGVTEPMLSASQTEKGQTWTCEVTVADAWSQAVASSTAIVGNTPPSTPVVAIAPGPASADLVCVASDASDVDADAITYVYAWRRNSVLTTHTTATVPAAATAPGETWTCEVFATDGEDASGVGQATTLVGNTVPDAPVVAILPASPKTNDALRCDATFPATDADGETVTATYAWLRNGADAGTNPTVDASQTSHGDVWLCTVTLSDGWSTSRASAEVTVLNSAPTAALVTIAPTNPTANSDLTCSGASSVDADNDTLTYAYRWLKDQTDTGITTPGVASAQTAPGEVWTCEVTVDDGWGGTAVSSADVTVSNRAPDAPSVSIAPTGPRTGDALNCMATFDPTDADGEIVTATYAWTRDGVAVATGSTVDATSTRRGEVWTCHVTLTDGWASANASAEVTILNTPPTDPTASISLAAPSANVDLTCVGAGSTDPDGDAVSYTYRWLRNQASTGITTAVLPKSNTAPGEEWTCEVTAFDGTHASQAATASVTIGNTAPEAPSIAVNPAVPTTSEDLSCNATFGAADADGEPVTVSYAWTRDGVAAATGPSVAAALTARGQVWACTATLTDGWTTTSASAAVMVVNSPPTAASVAIEPAAPNANQDLTCVGTGSNDADADALVYTYRWLKDNVPTGIATSVLSRVHTAPGETWTCEIRVTDGFQESPVAISQTVIGNTGPAAPVTTVLPAAPRTADMLTCDATFAPTDADGETVQVTYAWTKDGAPAATGSTVDATLTARGQVWECTATLSDGWTTSSASANVTVLNTPPAAPTVEISPASPRTADTLVCSATFAATDSDGDPIAVTYAWTRDGAPAGSGPTVSPTQTSRGQVWACTATVSDGAATASSTSQVSISNTPPTSPTATLRPIRVTTDDDVTCQTTQNAVDADGDNITYTLTWWINGQPTGIATSQLSRVWTAPGDEIACHYTASDGTAAGAPAVATTTVLGSDQAWGIYFNGDDAARPHVEIPGCLGSDTFTVEGWFKPAQHTVQGMAFGDDRLRCFDAGASSFGTLAQHWVCEVQTVDDLIVLASTDPIELHRWQHIAVGYDGTDYVLYVDGIENDRAAGASLAPSTWSSFGIGGHELADAGSTFHGTVDDFRCSSSVMRSGDFSPERRHQYEPGVDSIWHFNEGTGPDSTDANVGATSTLLNGALWVRIDDAICGNGLTETGEMCDDANANENDGCTSDCQATTCGTRARVSFDDVVYIDDLINQKVANPGFLSVVMSAVDIQTMDAQMDNLTVEDGTGNVLYSDTFSAQGSWRIRKGSLGVSSISGGTANGGSDWNIFDLGGMPFDTSRGISVTAQTKWSNLVSLYGFYFVNIDPVVSLAATQLLGGGFDRQMYASLNGPPVATVFDNMVNGGGFLKAPWSTPTAGWHTIRVEFLPTGCLCGNGILDGGEACDDGNVNNADGCSATCTVEVIGSSCLQLLNDGYSTGDGVYLLDLDGAGPRQPFQAYCDMTTDGGGWTRVVNVVPGSVGHADQPQAFGDIANPSAVAKLSDADITAMNTVGYWRWYCGTGKRAFVRNTQQTFTSARYNTMTWTMDNNRDGVFECAASRNGYGFSDFPACSAGHTNYTAANGAGEGTGCFVDGQGWGRPGSLWVK